MRRDDFFLKLKGVGTKLYLSRHCPCIRSEGLRETTDTLGVVWVPVENRIRQILSYIGIITAVTNLICIWSVIKIINCTICYSLVKLRPWSRWWDFLSVSEACRENMWRLQIYIYMFLCVYICMYVHKSPSFPTGRQRRSLYSEHTVKFVHICNQTESNKNSVSCNRVNSPAQDTTALQPCVFLTGINELPVINFVAIWLLPAQPLA